MLCIASEEVQEHEVADDEMGVKRSERARVHFQPAEVYCKGASLPYIYHCTARNAVRVVTSSQPSRTDT